MNKNKNKSNKKAMRVQSLPSAYAVSSNAPKRNVKVESGVDVFVDDVLGNTTPFSVLNFAINPGVAARFPALSLEAARFDRYEFESLSFHFVGTTVITTTPGQIGLAFEPNPNSDAPDDQGQFTAYESHSVASVYNPDGLWLHVPKRMLAGIRFVRTGLVGFNYCDYDPGHLILLTRDNAAATTIGYVEVHYRIRFYDYHLRPALEYSANAQELLRDVTQSYTTGVPGLVAWDTSEYPPQHGLGLVAGSTVIPPAGKYFIWINLACQNDTAEDTRCYAKALRSTAIICQGHMAQLAVADMPMSMSLVGMTEFDGVQAFSLEVTITGAAGTLILVGGRYTRVIFKVFS
jgi:hypothetical protein